jgi:hypothetical protein
LRDRLVTRKIDGKEIPLLRPRSFQLVWLWPVSGLIPGGNGIWVPFGSHICNVMDNG